MTEPTDHPDRTVHPAPDTLADHAEGLLPSAQAAEVARHLLTCPQCRDTRDALAEVRTLLTAYADPGPMPADVADRLGAALAAEGPLDPADQPDDGDAEERSPVVAAASTVVPAAAEPARRPTRTPFGSKVLQVAAVVVLFAAVAGIALSALLSHRGGDTGGASSGAGGSAADQAAGGSSAGAIRKVTIHAATGTAYSISNLGTVARSIAAGERSSVTPVAPAAKSPEFAAGLPPDQRVLSDSSEALSTCVRRLTGAATTPVAVDLGTWAGTPATIIVLPGQDDPSTLDVFAVRASCPPGSFLGFVRVPR